MIQREEARAIAEAEARARGLGTRVTKVFSFDELDGRRMNIYSNPAPTRCWYAYVETPVVGLCSSTVILVDQDFGVVVFAGSAGDEG